MKKNAFADKRLKTFLGLKTKNTDWVHAKVVNFNLVSRTRGKKKTLIEEWIPEYAIPDGYTNPFEKDVLKSDNIRCQICDHNGLTRYGIILHEAKKYFLVVGMECYVLYESDNDKALRIQLLKRLTEEHIQNLVTKEKDMIRQLFVKDEDAKRGQPQQWVSYKEYNMRYKVSSTIRRDRWCDWSKTKFVNFLVKNCNYLSSIGYNPPEKMIGPRKTIQCLLEIAKYRIFKELLSIQHTKLGTYNSQTLLQTNLIHKQTGNHILDYYWKCVEKVKKYDKPKLEAMLSEDLSKRFAKYTWVTVPNTVQ